MNGNYKTQINNINITDKTSGKGKDAHGTMDEDTQKKATKIIEKAMKKPEESKTSQPKKDE